jgi:uncharacterized membrane protein YedE/YeeE
MPHDSLLLAAALGGGLVGLAAGALVLLDGRVAGVSSILGGLLRRECDDRSWRVAFLAGLLMAPLAHVLVAPVPPSHLSNELILLVPGGFLVGFGTRLGGGCTSGHGICGLARLSGRSLAATLVFMGVASATVFVARHVIGAGAQP